MIFLVYRFSVDNFYCPQAAPRLESASKINMLRPVVYRFSVPNMHRLPQC